MSRQSCSAARDGCALTREDKCAPEGIRTPNLLIRSQMLYPLSYGCRSPPDGVRSNDR